jgi:ubiquitin-conjugating enzyme E2 variant
MHRIVTVLEALGLLACAVLLWQAFQAVALQAGWSAGLWCAMALPIGYYCADLLSGLIHWICDSFGDAHTPLWGPMLVAPFRRHHQAPGDITRISLTENLGSSAIAGALVLCLWAPQALPAPSGVEMLERFTGLWCIGFAVLSNRFHRWAHLPTARRPRWMRRLQHWRILLPPQEHALHHRKPHRGNYCILSGWANPLCNRVPWAFVEAGLACVGIRTNFD